MMGSPYITTPTRRYVLDVVTFSLLAIGGALVGAVLHHLFRGLP